MVNRIKKMKKWVSAIKDVGQSLMDKEISMLLVLKLSGQLMQFHRLKRAVKLKRLVLQDFTKMKLFLLRLKLNRLEK